MTPLASALDLYESVLHPVQVEEVRIPHGSD
jgi:hypothetical protein